MHARETAEQADNVRQVRRPVTRSGSREAVANTASEEGVLELQRTLGNATVARMLEEDRHVHDDSCGHARPVQRSGVDQVLRSSGRPLDEPVREEMEARLGADFSDVRVHTDTAAQRSATEVGARAYTSGNHVVVGAGGADKHTLAHELTHVVQQRSGPVAGTDRGDGLLVSDPSDDFERAAEANATKVMSGPVPATSDRGHPAEGATDAGTVQRTAVQRADNTGTEMDEITSAAGNGPTVAAGNGPTVTFADTLPANPHLYTDLNGSYWIGPESQQPANYPPEEVSHVEQFCGWLSVHWLVTGQPAGGLRFSDLPNADRQRAIQQLIQWASAGGLQAQVTYAETMTGGDSVQLNQVQADANAGRFPVGTLIWFGSNVHAEAAVVVTNDGYLMYDPNTGVATRRDRAGFLAYIAHKNAFVVRLPDVPESKSCSCCVIM